ncbi:MAG: DUF547 domain-containing protein [Bradymonadia bacterium]
MNSNMSRFITIAILFCCACATAQTPTPVDQPTTQPAVQPKQPAAVELGPQKVKAPSVRIHQAFGEFLKTYVRGDAFDYDGASRDRKQLDAYVSRIAQTDPSTLAGREEKLAFYINAYNALTIASVLSFWPNIKSVSTIKPNFEFFKAPVHALGGKKVSLDQIENKIIRPTFNDPRIHAALNCASKSCPPLANFAFEADRLNDQLDRVFKAFANDPGRNRVDPETGVVALSKILDWYKVDFASAGGAAAYLARYVDDDVRKRLLLNPKSISFLEYDWQLNIP